MATSKNSPLVSFIQENQEKLYRIAYAHVKNRDAALDLVHTSIVKALQKQHTLRNQECVRTWFYRILVNECMSYFRRQSRVVYLADLGDNLMPPPQANYAQNVSLHITHYETSFTAYQTDYYYTVDLDGEQVLTLKDWFGDNYRQIVADSIRASLSQWSQKQQHQLLPNLDLDSLITEDRSFYLNEQGQAVVVFDKYELANGAAGRPEFVITQ